MGINAEANLGNVKLRLPHQRVDNQFNGGNHSVPHQGGQGRRLMDQNMFSVYRNSLKTGNSGAQPPGQLMGVSG